MLQTDSSHHMTTANYYTTLTAQRTRVISKIELIEIHINLLVQSISELFSNC